MQSEIKNIEKWNRVLQIIKDNLSEDLFAAWFEPVRYVSYDSPRLSVSVPSEFFVNQFEDRFYNLIKGAIKREFGDDTKLIYTYKVKHNDDASSVSVEGSQKSDINNSVERQARQSSKLFAQEQYEDIDPQLNALYNFENYCESNCNKLAVSIGKAIADKPEIRTFSPMFLFGDTGVGKTHLIQAIGIKIKEQSPEMRVLYVTSRVFESQYVNAVRKNLVVDFINFYQSIDVLIVDDIQELAGKTATQNTFYHIFNFLHQNGRQLIMSSDCPPANMDGMIDRLISRFKWGITVELQRPDYELRKDVLLMHSSRDGLEIPVDVLDFIAKNVTDSVRELEGVVASLLAHATIMNREINLDLARMVLSNTVKATKKQTNFEVIAETVCRHFGIEADLIYGKCRRSNINDARQVVMYLTRKYTQLSSVNIGSRLSRDHATVLHACNKVEEMLPFDKMLQQKVADIEKELGFSS